MDLFSAMDIGSSGMSAQRTLMNTISMNLANIRTTRSVNGGVDFFFCGGIARG